MALSATSSTTPPPQPPLTLDRRPSAPPPSLPVAQTSSTRSPADSGAAGRALTDVDSYAPSDRTVALSAPTLAAPRPRYGAAPDLSPPGSQAPIELRRGAPRSRAVAVVEPGGATPQAAAGAPEGAQAKALTRAAPVPLDRETFATPDVFEPRFYATHYPDLAAAGVVTDAQLEQHWLSHGVREGRQASPTFSTLWAQQQYGRDYPDLVATPEQTLRTWHGLSPEQKANTKTSALTADVPFGDGLKLDLYSPPGVPPGQKVPVVIALVGGGFASADKAHPTQVEMGTILAHHGVAVVSPEYHVTQGDDPRRFPTPQHDVQDALRYVRDHAAERGWDLDRVTILGGSAGGHLALNAAMNPDFADASLPKIRNVVALAPATDLTRVVLANGTPTDDAAAGWLDAYIDPSDRARASPLAHTRNPANADKRFYLSYADDDGVVVPSEQIVPFVAAMRDQQLTVDARPTGGHGDWLHPELRDNPSFDRGAFAAMARWVLEG